MKKWFHFLPVIMSLLIFQVEAAPSQIKVGAVFAMTGGIATYGQESVNGMKLALKKINAAGGVKGSIIVLKVEDNKSEPIETANAVTKLISVDKVSLVIGSVASSNTKAGAPIAQKAKVPMLTPASTAEDVTSFGEYISRTCFTDNFQGEVLAKFAFETLKAKSAAVIIDNSSDYSKGLNKVFRKKFKNFGGKVIDKNFAYVQKDTDFKSLLRKVKRMKPDVIFIPGYYTEVGLLLRQARSMGMTMPIIGGDGWDSPDLFKLAGKGVKNTFITSHFSPDDKDVKVQAFVKEYEDTYKAKPGAMAALGYDAMLVAADAMKRAKGSSAEALKIAINQTKGFVGITGSITLNKLRNAVKSAVILEATTAGTMKFKQKVAP